MYVASDGYSLHYRRWSCTGPVRGTIVALHGIQSHGGWYGRSSTLLAESGYEVFFLDRRGSGFNAGQRGHAPHEDRLLADVRQFLQWLKWQRRNEPPRPLVLMGVSWGGKLASTYAAKFPNDVDALALLYPGLFPRVRPSWWQRTRLAWAAAMGWGQVTARIPLNDPRLFTDSHHWQDFIRRDELALHRVSVDFLRANLRLTTGLLAQAGQLRGPVLFLLAGRDQICDNDTTHEFVRRMTQAQVTLKEYPQACHTLEFEDEPLPHVADLLNWLSGVKISPPR